MPNATVGFLTGNEEAASHYDDLLALAPDGVAVHVAPVGQWSPGEDAPPSALDEPIARAAAAIADGGWQAAAITGAPNAVRFPTLAPRLRQAVHVPVVSAMDSAAAALRALGTRKALLLTPFDDPMKARLRHYLASQGVDAVLPSTGFESVDAAAEATDEDVYAFAMTALAEAGAVNAIYFQGARLNPLPVLERLEEETGLPIVASNPAMLWHMASLVGYSGTVATGGGRLLRDWPSLA
jgi:maleate isomerase